MTPDSTPQHNIITRIIHWCSGGRIDAGLERWGQRGKNIGFILAPAVPVIVVLTWFGITPTPPEKDGRKEADVPVAERKNAVTDAKPKPADKPTGLTTGALPDLSKRPSMPSCVPESSAAAILDFLAGQEDSQKEFRLRFEGRRLCAAWLLIAQSSHKSDGGGWRVKLRKADWHPAVFADVRADAAWVRPGDLIRVEGLVEGYHVPAVFKWTGYIHLSSARIQKR